jgi:hypothetical protein
MSDIKRYQIEAEEKWMEFAGTIPAFPLKPEWFVQMVPPFAGAMARFRIYLTAETEKGAKHVSIYLDAYDALGCVGTPYWEVYPVNGDTERFSLLDTDGLIGSISRSLAIAHADDPGPILPAEFDGRLEDHMALDLEKAEREVERLRAAEKERDLYRGALIARHGGESVVLLGQLDEARAEVERLRAGIAGIRDGVASGMLNSSLHSRLCALLSEVTP